MIRGTAVWCVALATTLFTMAAQAQPPSLTWTVQSDYFARRDGLAQPRTIRGFALSDDDSSIYLGLIQSPGASTQILRKVSSDVLAIPGSDTVIFGNGGGPGGTGGFGPHFTAAPLSDNPIYPPAFTAPGVPGFEAWRIIGNTQPRSISTDDRGNVFVALRDEGVVRIYDADLATEVGAFTFTKACGVAVRQVGGVYYAYAADNSKVRRWDVTDVALAQEDLAWTPPLVLAGGTTPEGYGIDVDADGTVFVAGDNRVVKISADGTTVTPSAAINAAADVVIYQDKIYVVSRTIASLEPIRQFYKADLSSVGADFPIPDFGFARGPNAEFTAIDVSADGKLYVAEENYFEYPATPVPPAVHYTPPVTSFNPTPDPIPGRVYRDRVLVSSTLPPNNPPIVTSPDVIDGGIYEVKVGQTFDASFSGADDEGFDLTVTATGVPAGATFVPTSGTTGATPLAADLSYSPVEADFNTSHDVTVSYEDSANQITSISFTIEVPENEIPTVTAPSPVTVECEGDVNLVTLETTVDDGDDHPLTVTWFVNNVQEQQTTNVMPGSTVEFEFDFPHDVNEVEVVVTDGYDTATASTTVTVEDTTDPTIIVAQDVIVPTDPGEAFATNVVLTPPQVFDICDGDPTLTNDAPTVYPLGETIVTWTAEDADGNTSSGEQKVTVVDEEKPTISVGDDITVSVDSGEIFATVDLPAADADDNVPNGLLVTDDAPATFPIGKTKVTWTATDAAGNSATASLTVTVVNEKPVADAGADLSVVANSRDGIEVSLDGSDSSDADDQDLAYAWSASGISFDDATSPTPSANFPVGTTTVTLKVTDEAGATDTDTVKVIVSYAQLLVINERYYGLGGSPYAIEAAWRCQGLADNEPTNAFFVYSADAAKYAAAFNGYAGAVDYVDSTDYPDRLHLYKYYRYYQMQYDFFASNYVYWGYYYSPNAGFIYDYVLAAYLASGGAGYYGLADFNEP